MDNISPVITTAAGAVATILGAVWVFVRPVMTRLVDATEAQTRELQKIGVSLTVQQERFDAYQKTTEHNLRQLRTVVDALVQKPACEFDPTSATEVHEAAQQHLRGKRPP